MFFIKKVNFYSRTVFVLLFIIAFNGHSQTLNDTLIEYMNAQVNVNKFSGSVLVAQKGNLLLSKSFGFAVNEWKIKNTQNTKFNIGSVTKQFTAVAILQLVEKGKLKLNDPIKSYFPDYKKAKNITIEHLLVHTSGIENYLDIQDYRKRNLKNEMSPNEIYQYIKNRKLLFKPGEKFSYSNTGYVLLGIIIEKASGLPYDEYIEKNIFSIVGMNDSGINENSKLVDNIASGYTFLEDTLIHADYVNYTNAYSAGAIYSTVNDLLKWHKALNDYTLISKESTDNMFTPRKSMYGLGWAIAPIHNTICHTHSGGIWGFSSCISRYPDKDLCVIVLNNNGMSIPSCKIGVDLAAIVLGLPYSTPKVRQIIEVNIETLNKYVGVYNIAPSFAIEVTLENGKLYAQATNQGKYRIYSEKEDLFFYKVVEADLHFIMNSDGECNELELHQNGKTLNGKKQ